MTKYVNNYVFKAMSEFEYNVETAAEALHYALAYDENNTMALTLMGRLYAEKLFDYETGISYFKRALAERINAFEVYEPYIKAMINNEDYVDALDFIDFALTVKGVNKSKMYMQQALVYECQFDYDTALNCIEKAKMYTYENNLYTINEMRKRIMGKMPKKKKKEKSA